MKRRVFERHSVNSSFHSREDILVLKSGLALPQPLAKAGFMFSVVWWIFLAGRDVPVQNMNV